jgi:hypothetical protein
LTLPRPDDTSAASGEDHASDSHEPGK